MPHEDQYFLGHSSVEQKRLQRQAEELARDRGWSRSAVEVRQGHAASTGLPRGQFDLATARLVLVNIPEPEKIVTEMATLVRSGGVVALHEADWSAHVCDPPLPAWDRLKQALTQKKKESIYTSADALPACCAVPG